MRMIPNKKGQSILEYTLILAAIIAVLVWVILRPGGIKSTVQTSYEKVGGAVNTTTQGLTYGIYSTT